MVDSQNTWSKHAESRDFFDPAPHSSSTKRLQNRLISSKKRRLTFVDYITATCASTNAKLTGYTELQMDTNPQLSTNAGSAEALV